MFIMALLILSVYDNVLVASSLNSMDICPDVHQSLYSQIFVTCIVPYLSVCFKCIQQILVQVYAFIQIHIKVIHTMKGETGWIYLVSSNHTRGHISYQKLDGWQKGHANILYAIFLA